MVKTSRVNPYSCYQKALVANAATSALRLHQRLPNVRLTREFLGRLLIEDSCHYLFFSLIFLYTYPITSKRKFSPIYLNSNSKFPLWTLVCLVPIFLFALLHSSSYTLALLGVSLNTKIGLFMRIGLNNSFPFFFFYLKQSC